MNDIAQKRILDFKEKVVKAINSKLGGEYPQELRARFIKLLAEANMPEVEGTVFSYLQHHPEQEDAIYAACNFENEEIDQFLIESIRNERSPHRDLMTEQLGYRKSQTLIGVLKELLADKDRHVRFQAANSLHRIGGKDAALALCDYISDEDEWISMTILRILCDLKEHESIPILSEKFHQDDDLRRKALMVSFLARFKSVTLINIFDEGIRGRDARLKANSIEAIGNLNLPQKEIKERIEPFLRDPNNRIRANSILALAKSEPEKVKSEIIEMVNSNDVQLRRSAAFILGMIPSEDYHDLVEKLVEDDSDVVRTRMIRSLRSFSSDFVCKQLEKTISDSNKWIRKYSIDMAANISNFPSDKILALLKTERAAPNLKACMDYFSRKPMEEALKGLKLHVKDKRVQVVKALLGTISAIKGISGVKELAPRLDQRSPEIVQALTISLLKLGERKILEDLVEKFASIKDERRLGSLVPAVSACLRLVNDEEEITEELKEALEKIEVAEQPQSPEVVPESLETETADAELPTMEAFESLGDLSQETLPDLEQTLEVSVEQESPKPKSKVASSYRKGVKAFNIGKYKRALKEFNMVLEGEEEIPPKLYYYMGLIACDKGTFEQARNYLQTYLKHNPEHSKANYTLGKVLKELREWDSLIRVFSKFTDGTLDASPKAKKKIYRELGIACVLVGKNERGRELLELLHRVDPKIDEVNYYLALAKFNLGKMSGAEALLDTILNGDGHNKRVRKLAEALRMKVRSGGR